MRISVRGKIKAALCRGRQNAGQKKAAGGSKPPFGGRKAVYPTLFLCGLAAGLIICCVIKSALMYISLDAGLAAARSVSGRAPSFASAKTGGGIGAFTSANPFGADMLVRKSSDGKAGGGKPAELHTLSLRGTLPDVAAWIEGPGGVSLVLKGQKISGYTLEDIDYKEAFLTDGTKQYSIYLILSDGKNSAPKAASRPKKQPVRQPPKKPDRRALDFSGVEAASEGQEGAVPRELVDELLMNPYDEIAKLRMVPSEDSSGMKLDKLDSDSILAKVGVAQGDVINAINGVSISNVGDAANAMNSLMSGTRFDVTVIRDGKPLELRYQVK